MSVPRHSMATRVALATALSVIVASTCVALISQLIALRMAHTREDKTLLDTAETMALELRAKDADPRAIALDETHELAHTAMRLAVFEGAVLRAGDRALTPVHAGGCADLGALRACGASAGPWLAVIARDGSALRSQRDVLALACTLAVLLTSGLGALVASLVARRVTQPLGSLTRAVERLPVADPARAELGPASGLAEVDVLRDSMQAAFTRLSTAMSQARRFASDAAHELRTPLATLLGELDLIAEDAEPGRADGIARAHRVARRMAMLVDRLLILAQLDTLEATEQLDVSTLLEEVLDTLPHEAVARLSIVQAAPSRVRGDRTLLIAALSNAIDNGLKFSDLAVQVTVGRRAGSVEISVADRGPGLADAQHALMFEPFYRSPSARARGVPGHGIGLALIAHVLALHEGTAHFAEISKGATLVLRLPSADDPEASVPPGWM